MSLVIRHARPDDCDLIVALIRELAVYERLEHEVVATAEDLRSHLFGETRYAEAVIAESDGEPAGFALFFHNYSTFRGRPGLYLEDLYVRPAYRGRGLGKGLLLHLAKVAVARDCARMEWAVLDWNAPAIAFYESLGARAMSDWTIYRLDGTALARLGASSCEPNG